jgi:hypothetical protein
MWRGFEQVVGGPLRAAGITVIPVAGNHDASAFKPFAADRAAYEDYWLAHAPPLVLEAGSRYPWHYAVSLGGVRLVALYATAPGDLAPDQYDFLLRLLAGSSLTGTHTLLVSHLPVYPVSRGRERETINAELPPGSGVGAWFSGHHHAYYPGRSADGDQYIAIPALGGNQRQWLESAAHGPFGFLHVAASGSVTLHAAPEFEPETVADMPGRIGALQLMREPRVYAGESLTRVRFAPVECCP